MRLAKKCRHCNLGWLLFCLFEARSQNLTSNPSPPPCRVYTVHCTLNTASNSGTLASNWQNTSSPKYVQRRRLFADLRITHLWTRVNIGIHDISLTRHFTPAPEKRVGLLTILTHHFSLLAHDISLAPAPENTVCILAILTHRSTPAEENIHRLTAPENIVYLLPIFH